MIHCVIGRAFCKGKGGQIRNGQVYRTQTGIQGAFVQVVLQMINKNGTALGHLTIEQNIAGIEQIDHLIHRVAEMVTDLVQNADAVRLIVLHQPDEQLHFFRGVHGISVFVLEGTQECIHFPGYGVDRHFGIQTADFFAFAQGGGIGKPDVADLTGLACGAPVKVLAIVLALSMVFTLCACGQKPATENTVQAGEKAKTAEAPATEKATEGKKHYTFGYLAYDMSDTWNEYSANAFMYAAEQQKDVEIEVVLLDPKMDLEASISAMESLIQQGVDGISAAPFSAEEGAQLVKMAKEAGIPITIENRKLDDVSEDDYIAAVACQYADIGYAAIEFIAKTAPGSKIFYCAGKDGSGVTEQYIQGVNKALEDYSDKVELVATLNGDWKTDVSYDITTNLISSGTEFNYIFANNDLQAMGCYNALKDAGMENIPIVSTGGSPDGYKMMCNGVEYANMTAPVTLQGVKTFLNLYEYVVLGQQPAQKFTSLPVVPISQENLDKWMQWDDYEVAYRYYVK